MRFLAEFVIVSAVLTLSVLPIIHINKQLQRFHRIRNWYIGAVVTALVVAIIGWTSRILVDQCLAERNAGCVDSGSTGMQVVIIAGFLIWSLGSWKMTKDS